MSQFETSSVETRHIPHEIDDGQPQDMRRMTPSSAFSPLRGETPAFDLAEDEAAGLESFSPVVCNLSFACLLIPRFSDHYLTGDITEYLAQWLKEICIAYGWRLDELVVRPGYLQWLLTVPPDANPAQFMRIIRQHTSLKIFNDFPRLKQKNMSGDFWAPGYYVISGGQLQPLENINTFILQTRQHQGIY